MGIRLRFITVLFVVLSLALAAWPAEVRVIATGDMHGWLQPQAANGQVLGGTAEMLAYWRRAEHYKPKDFLVVSCGDIATGPAISTAFKGDPAVEVMNMMGYDVSALGNHEFDFGIDKLRQWKTAAKFPFICANLYTPDGQRTDLTAPYVINDEQGVKVAVIGLIFTDIAESANTGGLVGRPYADVLRAVVPEVRAKGAQIVIVASHIPLDELAALAGQVKDLGIPLMLGGHSHEFGQKKIGDTWVANNGLWWDGYSRFDLNYNPKTQKAVVLSARQVWLQQVADNADPAVKADLDRWQARLDKEFNTIVGYIATGFTRPVGVGALIGACWMGMAPDSDLVLFNQGGFRQDLAAGDVNKGHILGVMPFENGLVRISMTGKQILELKKLGKETLGFAGVRKDGDRLILQKTGKAIEPDNRYQVLVNDYLYNKSPELQAADPKPIYAFGDWRLPVLDWLAKHPTSKEQPLEKAIGETTCYIP